VVVDLEGKGFVRGADESAADGAGALADGEGFPVILIGALDEHLEAVAAAEDGIEGKAGECGEGGEEEQEKEQANFHRLESGPERGGVKCFCGRERMRGSGARMF
jgi:hypothetical protein